MADDLDFLLIEGAQRLLDRIGYFLLMMRGASYVDELSGELDGVCKKINGHKPR
ncbi:hypothetical protein CFL01nite_01730 [Corynebacterium flavescens]|uniref:Uncharacterized protein n=1 Tax=Corynebacterium flavescens TaxID=28028 RepID=A0AB73B4V9_CORFL|nr:hypothetical protein CFL01nite_01730 [Corynebacterium flavescens]